ncbi:tyrosine-type recombinase/integrase [Robertmurraya massiliosenegalensis]|uniref:tyrosine-type recombinase/integrase n=1 Tax=Robertmurraya massiliosenegalensis TaxID=1287657 RepID=UPI00292A405A|nr:tyrosine-type recombinase/integrase [Robertmurraya massiliosenegalensis]
MSFVFYRRRVKLTRTGSNYIVDKYKKLACEENKILIPEVFSCHCLRHSKAMHLLQAGVNLVYIRDILGHCSVQVTEIYAKTDSKQKREAIEKAYVDVSPTDEPVWEKMRVY